jgi:hypothetical protein
LFQRLIEQQQQQQSADVEAYHHEVKIADLKKIFFLRR